VSEFTLKDSGAREEFSTGSRRDTGVGKGRYDLIPVLAFRRLAALYETGARKYGDRNWEKGQPLGRYLGSAFRHLVAVMNNERDEDHAFQAVWNMIGYEWTLDAIKAGRLPLELDDVGAVHTRLKDTAGGLVVPVRPGMVREVTIPRLQADGAFGSR
jgi:Domain of unknown function (DUF5664)